MKNYKISQLFWLQSLWSRVTTAGSQNNYFSENSKASPQQNESIYLYMCLYRYIHKDTYAYTSLSWILPVYELTNFKSPQLLAIQLSSTNSFTFFSNCLIFSSGLFKKKVSIFWIIQPLIIHTKFNLLLTLSIMCL